MVDTVFWMAGVIFILSSIALLVVSIRVTVSLRSYDHRRQIFVEAMLFISMIVSMVIAALAYQRSIPESVSELVVRMVGVTGVVVALNWLGHRVQAAFFARREAEVAKRAQRGRNQLTDKTSPSVTEKR